MFVFMDDWIVIAPSRWKLRRAVKKVNTILAALLLEKHPNKTFIGRTARGFAFLGYFLTPWGISVAQDTYGRLVERATRLYEQEPGEPCGSSRFGQYVKRWSSWLTAGIFDRWLYIIVQMKTILSDRRSRLKYLMV